MPRHLYIYYRVTPARHADALAAVERLFQDVAAAGGVTGRLQQRSDDPGTWMEIYSPATDGLAELVERCAAVHFAGLLEAGRHMERFQDLDVTPSR